MPKVDVNEASVGPEIGGLDELVFAPGRGRTTSFESSGIVNKSGLRFGRRSDGSLVRVLWCCW